MVCLPIRIERDGDSVQKHAAGCLPFPPLLPWLHLAKSNLIGKKRVLLSCFFDSAFLASGPSLSQLLGAPWPIRLNRRPAQAVAMRRHHPSAHLDPHGGVRFQQYVAERFQVAAHFDRLAVRRMKCRLLAPFVTE